MIPVKSYPGIVWEYFQDYLRGDLTGWDLSDYILSLGYSGFSVTEDCQLIVYTKELHS